jgi:hypothetical protein
MQSSFPHPSLSSMVHKRNNGRSRTVYQRKLVAAFWLELSYHLQFLSCFMLILLKLWHICSKQEFWSQKKRPLLRSSTVKTSDKVFSMRFVPRSYSNRDARNRGTVGNSVFYEVSPEARVTKNWAWSAVLSLDWTRPCICCIYIYIYIRLITCKI